MYMNRSTKQSDDDDEQLLTVGQAALRLSVSEAFLYREIQRGRLKPDRLGNKIIRFRRSQIDQWIQTNSK